MPGANPFNASYLYANSTNSQAKAKKEPALCPQTNFHQRPVKIEKSQGRLTPLLTGRVTPLCVNSYKAPSNVENPASVKSVKSSLKDAEEQNQQPPISAIKIEAKTADKITTMASSSLPPISQIDKISNSFQLQRLKEDQKTIYSIPKSSKFSRPTLETGVLEIRTSITQFENSRLKNEEELISPNSVFHDHEPSQT